MAGAAGAALPLPFLSGGAVGRSSTITARGVFKSSIASGATFGSISCSTSLIIRRSIFSRTATSAGRPWMLSTVCAATWPVRGSAATILNGVIATGLRQSVPSPRSSRAVFSVNQTSSAKARPERSLFTRAFM